MSRRFFSGRSLQAAVLSAAAKFNLDPDELAYEEIDKRHGLLKSRGKVVIAVDPNQPRKGAGGGEPAEEPAPAPAGEPKAEPAAPPSRRRAAATEEAPEPEEEAEEAAEAAPAEEEKPSRRPSRRRRRPAPEAEAAAEGAEERAAEPEEAAAAAEAEEPEEEASRSRRGRGRGRREEPSEEQPSEEAEPPRRSRGARAARDEEPEAEEPGVEEAEEVQEEPERPRRAREARREEREGLVELPDRPRALADRYPRARGPLAKAAKQAIDAIAAVGGLDVEAAVFEGDDRLEIDLSGPHHALLIAEDGELLVAIEHLLPRVMRGFGGETAAVRVDCENFQEIREERLRSYAQVVAGEVRRTGRSRNLDPLSPSDRRIVHLTVADEPGVESESEGSGYLKKVRVSPA